MNRNTIIGSVLAAIIIVAGFAIFVAVINHDDTPKTTAVAQTQPNNKAGDSISITDPRIKDLSARAQRGEFKTSADVVAAAKKAGFSDAEVASVLSVINTLPLGTVSARAAASTCPQDYHVDAHQEFDVPPGCNVKGDVSVLENGKWVAKYDNDANTGLIVSCPNGCKIRPDFDGANVTPRDVNDLETEMKQSGCGSKCTSVQKVVIDSGNGKAQPTPSASPSATATPTTSQPLNDKCEPEIPLGQKRVVKAGCIVAGDVLVRPAGSTEDFKPVFDNRQKTGTVQLLDKDFEVWNVQGASVYPAGMKLEDAVAAMKAGGCGTGIGCPDGVFDWSGKRLDQ